jgi:hypothetical protein
MQKSSTEENWVSLTFVKGQRQEIISCPPAFFIKLLHPDTWYRRFTNFYIFQNICRDIEKFFVCVNDMSEKKLDITLGLILFVRVGLMGMSTACFFLIFSAGLRWVIN